MIAADPTGDATKSILYKLHLDARDVFVVPVRLLDPRAVMLDCFYNVRGFAEIEGGSILFGWCIWLAPGKFIEAEHHAIWLSPEGEKIDITPKEDGETEITFVANSKIPFDFGKPLYRDNFRLATSSDPVVADYLNVKKQLSRLERENSFVVGRDREIRLPPKEIPRWKRLKEREAILGRKMGQV